MKRISIIFILACLAIYGISAQNKFPDLKKYFMIALQLKSPEWDFKKTPFYGDDPTDSDRFSNLTGNLKAIDSYIEFALCVYYSAAEKTTAEKGNSILPLNNPILVDKQLGAYIFMDLQMLRFLNDTAAVSRHETMLKWITDRKNATRSEIEAFYRDNIRGLIAAVVDEEFNKVSFLLENYSTNSKFSYNAILSRNQQNGQYKLTYERPDIPNSKKELFASSLEALLSAMQNSNDFVPTAINTVKAQAALIPAAALSDAALNEVKTILTNFYINPNAATYACVKEIHIVLMDVLLSTKNVRYGEAYHAYERALSALNDGLTQKVLADVWTSSAITTLTRDQQHRLVELRR